VTELTYTCARACSAVRVVDVLPELLEVDDDVVVVAAETAAVTIRIITTMPDNVERILMDNIPLQLLRFLFSTH
jgi:hypothetical protein